MYLYYYFYLIPMLIISNFMILFMNSYIYMWMIMEINLISFISILIMNKFIYMEILMNYFLIQSLNSYLFMFSMILKNLMNLNMYLNLLIFMALISKLGLPPFYMWYVKMNKHLNWIMFYLNSSVQKFIPLLILSNYLNLNNFLMFMIIIMIYSSFINLNMYSLKLIMSMSSMIQMVWLLTLMFMSEKLWLIYYLIYNMISLSLFYMFYKLNLNYNFELNTNKMNFLKIYFINMMIFSLASLPPLSGFLNKWMFMYMISDKYSIYLNMMIMLISLFSLYFYLRISIFTNLIYMNNINLKFKNNKLNINNKFIFSIFLMIFMLLIMEL